MKTAIAFASAILTATMMFSVASNASAQTNQTGVCVVDMSLIFKSHPVFENQMSSLRKQAEQLQASLDQQAKTLNEEVEQLKAMDVGSPAYKQLETQLAKKTADLEIKRRDQLRELVSKEARLHFNTYVEINGLVSAFCNQNGVQLILRYARPAVDTKNPQSIMQWVNGDIVWIRPQYDITDRIIEQLNQKYAQNGAPQNQSGNNN